MSSSFVLLLVVVGAYVAAHVAFDWLARRFYLVSGIEYLLLGLLLGPQVSGLISPTVVGGFAPFLTLALGWIGVSVGAQFHLPELIRIPRAHFRIAFFEALFTFVVVAGVLGVAFSRMFGLSGVEAASPAAAIAAIATASSPTGIALMSRRRGRQGPVVRQLQLTSAVDALVAIAAIGILLCFDHSVPPGAIRPPTATEWAVISVAIGVVGGALFHLFLGDERKIDRLFIALAGAIILTSGAAAYLRLSPLFAAMLMGLILINTSRSRVEIRQVLSTVERPLYFVLLIFAGAAWRPSELAWLLPVVLFLVVRTAAKVGGSALAAALNGALPALGAGWGRALLGQGGLAIAVALNYQIQERSILSNVIFTAAILSVLVTDLTAARVAEIVIRSAPARPGAPRPVPEEPRPAPAREE